MPRPIYARGCHYQWIVSGTLTSLARLGLERALANCSHYGWSLRKLRVGYHHLALNALQGGGPRILATIWSI